MIHLRIVAPPEQAARAVERLERTPTAVNVVHLPGAARKPVGDVVLCDVAREQASVVIGDLRARGLDGPDCSIAVESIETSLSLAADEAERAAPGSPADAVVWEEVEARTSESAHFSFSFAAFMVLATLIAAAGIITDSTILIIGAMIVGPEFGPLAGLCVALVQRRGRLARRSLVALAVGFPVAITASYVATLLLKAAGTAPDRLAPSSHPGTLFISNPNTWSVLVAAAAGIAGMISLTTAKSGALIGVLVSVTTIPAAANVGVACAYEDWSDWRGAMAQLAINLGTLVLAGLATLALQRAVFGRRRRRHLLARRRPDPDRSTAAAARSSRS